MSSPTRVRPGFPGRRNLIAHAVLAGCIASLLAGCRLLNPPQIPGPPQLDCASIAGQLNPSGRLAAMLSVHASAFGASHADFNFINLTLAARILECDFRAGGALARSRKRRAVAELAAFGRFDHFAAAVAILGANLNTIRAAVQAQYPGTYWYLLAHPTLLEMAVSNLIATNPPLGGIPAMSGAGVCEWFQEQPFAVWHVGPSLTVSGEVSVTAPVGAVKRHMDGQSWDECSQFWDPPTHATELIEKQGGTYAPMTNPPPPGSDYASATLSEHFVCKGSGAQAFFDNRLTISNTHMSSLPTHPSMAGLMVNYSLPPGGHLNGCVNSLDATCTGGTKVAVETDYGWLEVFDNGTRTVVYTNKVIKFDNAVVNGISLMLLTHAELARELGEHACCYKAAAT